jgi:hypothetical protein
MTAESRVRQRVGCPCGWRGYRIHVNSRDCKDCGADRSKIEALWPVGQGPRRWFVYVLHFVWHTDDGLPPIIGYRPDGTAVRFHAGHYLGASSDLPARLRDHRNGIYIPGGKKQGRGALFVARAVSLGATIELGRLWHAPPQFEARLKQARKAGSTRCGVTTGSRRYCSICSPDDALEQWPQEEVNAWVAKLRAPAEARRAARARHRAEVAAGVWDADAEWDKAFPHLAYDAAAAAPA